MLHKATPDLGTMYMDGTMTQTDKQEVINAKKKEGQNQMKNGNFTILSKMIIPKDKSMIPVI